MTDPEDRRRSQALAVCLVVLATLFAGVDTVLSATVEGYRAPWFGYLALAGAFLLNRFGHYRIAAPMAVLMFPCVAFAIVFSGNGMPLITFGYLMIAPMVAANLLPIWGVAALTVLDVCGIAAAGLYVPEAAALGSLLVGPLSANAMVGLLAVVYMHQRNVLERDRRRALEDSEERLRLSLDAAQMGTWQLDCAQQTLSLDARASTMLGACTGQRGLLEAFEADDASVLEEAIEATCSGEAPGFALAAHTRAALGSRVAELTGRAVSDAGGRVLRVNGTVVDVSQRRSLEAQLRRSQKMEALGRMSGGIAHDFNNVLAVITASATLLRRRNPGPELDRIETAARSGAALTSKLLAFSRGAVLAPRVLDLDAVVRDSVPLIERLVGEHIRVHHRSASERWRTRLDGSQVEQVLLNLAANARDAMPDGGTLEIEVDNIHLEPHQLLDHPDATAGCFVRLRVTDSGAGMDEQTKRHIFEPFFTTKERGKGTGLGLAMVFGTVSQSGGFIEAQSTPGSGARFDLYFPRAQGVDTRAARAAHPATNDSSA